ncbi:hypothetical protein, partial [Aliarcobacter butzleri]|uniref:hypothetical protein n=1 Tax=Aliarcobacter butzleri TaxID=28197 RepID=UPI00263CC127
YMVQKSLYKPENYDVVLNRFVDVDVIRIKLIELGVYMQIETLNLTAWEQIKEKVKRWFGKGEYGTARDFLTLHKMRENSIDLEFLLITKEFKENGLTKDVYGTQYDLKQEFKDFEQRKVKGEFVGENEQKALEFLEKYKLKLSDLE